MKVLLSILLTLAGTFAFGQTTTLNVTNFGAVGDAVQFYVNTVSNSVLVTTTNHMPATSIGEAIEIFQAGVQTHGVNSYGTNAYANQDLVAIITNLVNGTNIYLNVVASNTLTSAFATYGHDNRTNFQNAIDAATPNTTVYIPSGTYLILSKTNLTRYWYSGLTLTHGGITIEGAGPNSTRLLSQGAWQFVNVNGGMNPWRGILFEEYPPIANNSNIVLANLTMDGGVQQGNTSIHGEYVNPVDGLGWDTSHDAFLVASDQNGLAFNQMTWTNVVFQHWRGEMVKSVDQSTNGNLLVENCTFQDGNATAINIYPSINFTKCVFNNLFQVAEYYQAYSTNTCYFQNNLITNITANGFAINGGKGNNPNFIIRNNTFYFPGNGYNGIETVPADNVLIQSNLFICQNYANVINLGASGYQGTFDNSNIVVIGNTIINPATFIEINGGVSATDVSRVESVSVLGNTLSSTPDNATLLQTFGWTTNINFQSNDCSGIAYSVACNSGADGAAFVAMNTNNTYYTHIYDLTGQTNFVDYAKGSRYEIIYGAETKTAYALVNTDSSQIPAGARILIYNNNTSSSIIPFYLNSACTGGPISVAAGQTFVATWINNAWVPSSSGSGVNPGVAVMQVMPGNINFGSMNVGMSATNSFTVENVGGSTLTGTATVTSPFSIVSGAGYNLAANQSQTIAVAFSPTSAGSYNQTVVLAGGGTNVTVSGAATNAVVNVAPTVSSISPNVSNLGGNPSVWLVNSGPIQLSASASANNNDAISWQWRNSVNGGPQAIVAQGAGNNPMVNFTNSVDAGGNTNFWTLNITDSQNGLSAQSQITIVVKLPWPQGVNVNLQASTN